MGRGSRVEQNYVLTHHGCMIIVSIRVVILLTGLFIGIFSLATSKVILVRVQRAPTATCSTGTASAVQQGQQTAGSH